MRAILEFNLPEDTEDLKRAQLGPKYYGALSEVVERVFRPARKHGYSEGHIERLINKLGPDAVELVFHLEQEYYSILSDYSLEDLQ